MSKGARVRSGRSRSGLLEKRQQILALHFLRRGEQSEVDQPQSPSESAEQTKPDGACPKEWCGRYGKWSEYPCITKAGKPAKKAHQGRKSYV